MNYFFVYGTLMKDLKYHDIIRPYVKEIKKASIRGTLYHLNYGYPALILDGKHTVYGEWIQVDQSGEVLKRLDELEDYYGPGHPDNHYERKVIRVENTPGYVYEWILPLEGIATFVPGQNWRSFIQNSIDPA
jgi:gamma-glutamylcyclotransferase (GGCT)/AIG2-like uncharacterized protein YtfP